MATPNPEKPEKLLATEDIEITSGAE